MTVTIDADAIPSELKERNQWLLWDRDAERKQPFTIGDRGQLVPASWTDPDEWLSFEDAYEAVEANASVGLGYVFANTNDEHAHGVYGALDLDGVVDDVGAKDWLPSLDPFLDADAYIERSPSGDGLHIPLAGFDPPDWWADKHKSADEHEGVEAYGSKFFTFTGDRIDGAGREVAEHDEFVEDWLAEAYEALTGEDPRTNGTDGVGSSTSGNAPAPPSYNDEWLTQEDVEDALDYISGSLDYDTWRNIGFALADFFDNERTALRVFEKFSRGKPKWDSDAADQAERIISDESSGKVGIGTVIHHAKKGGWEVPSPAQTVQDIPDSDTVDSDDLDLEGDEQLDKQAWESWADERTTGTATAESRVPKLALQYIARTECHYDTSEIPDDAQDLPALAHNRALRWVNNTWAEQQNVDTVEIDGEDRVTTTPYVSRTSGPTCTWDDVRYAYGETAEDGRYSAVCLLRNRYEFLTPEDTEELHVYVPERGVYEAGAKYDIGRELDRNLGTHYSTHEKNEILTRLREETVDREELEAGALDGTYICVSNGVLDVDNRDLLDHDAKYLFTRGLDVAYDPDADCPETREFLTDITRRTADWQTMVEMLGHSLLPHYDYEAFMVLFGRGANGKSTWFNVVREFLNRDNVENITLQKLTERPFAASNLLGQWANIGEDLPGSKIQDMGMLKDLTGGGSTFVEPKGKQGFDLQNRATMMFAANEPPVLGERSHAVARRILPIRLPNRYTAADDEHKDRDDEILERMTTDEELSGLLNLALDGIERLRTKQDFSLPESPQERLEYYEQFSDHIKMFSVNCLENSAEGEERKADVYNAYTRFCEEKNRDPVGKQMFWRQLRKTTLNVDIHRPQRANGERPRVCANLTFTAHGRQFAPNYETPDYEIPTLSSLAPGDEGITVEGVVTEVETDQPDEIQAKATLTDETDSVALTLWSDSNIDGLDADQAYRLKQVRVQEYGGDREVHVTKRTGIEEVSRGVGNVPAADAGDNQRLNATPDGGQTTKSTSDDDIEQAQPHVKKAVQDNERDYDEGVPHALVLGEVVQEGFESGAVEHALEDLLEKGELYTTNDDDHYRTT